MPVIAEFSAPWRNSSPSDFSPWGGVQMKTLGTPPVSYQFATMTPAQFTVETGAPGPADGLAVARFTVHPGDNYRGHPTEVCEVVSPPPPRFSENIGGMDSWWTWSTFVPTGWTPSTNWNIFFELHPDPAAGAWTGLSPNIALSARAGTYYFTVNGGPVAADGDWSGRYRNNDVPLVIGGWQDFALFVRWDSTGTAGRVVLWTRPQTASRLVRVVDSLTMVDAVNHTGGGPIRTMYSWQGADVRIYPLYGHYRNADPTQTHVVYHGGLYHSVGLSI